MLPNREGIDGAFFFHCASYFVTEYNSQTIIRWPCIMCSTGYGCGARLFNLAFWLMRQNHARSVPSSLSEWIIATIQLQFFGALYMELEFIGCVIQLNLQWQMAVKCLCETCFEFCHRGHINKLWAWYYYLQKNVVFSLFTCIWYRFTSTVFLCESICFPGSFHKTKLDWKY
jgi:hypothetical protein